MENIQSTPKGHPKGLYVLFATEFWERFSYYGMRAIFMLFMTKYLFFNKALASNIYGTYTGLVYLTPLIGGYVADRYWGNRKSIFVGGILMAIGQFLLFGCASLPQDSGSSQLLLWSGLGFLIFGNGFFKPNISTMVGQLYPDNDVRKDGAYSIFYMGINAGAFFAPLVCGYLGENVDFKWGFFSAAIGMLIGLFVFYLTKNKYIITPTGEQLGTKPNKEKIIANTDEGTLLENSMNAPSTTAFSGQQLAILIGGILGVMSLLYFVLKIDFWGSLIYGMTLVAPFVIITDKSLTKPEKDRLWVIILVMIFVVFFWMCFEQAGASLTFFADEQTNRTLFGWTMPASYFQSFNAGFIVLLAPIISVIWLRLAKKGKNPSAPYKQSLGLMFLSLGFLFIAFGAKNIPPAGASIIFLTGLYFIHTIGELCLSPIGLSMVNKLTPLRFTSLMMGVWFLAIATGNKLAGSLSSLYPEQQTVAAEFDAEKVTLNGSAVMWDTIVNKRTVDANTIWKLNMVKKNAKSEEADSLVSIDVQTVPNAVAYDTTKVKRIIPAAYDEKQLKKLEKFEDKEPKFLFAVGEQPNTVFLLRNEMTKRNNTITLQKWNTDPKPPVFLGMVIKDLYSYFMLFVALSGIAAIILFLLAGRLSKMMHGVK
jgi:proton-dependent oligopeptide transporter, POT family